MLIWLVVLIVGLVGVLVLFQSGVAGPEGLPALPTAAAVIAVLAIAYLLATRTRGDGEAKLRPFLIGLMIAGLISAAVALISGLLWKSPGPATTERGGDDFALSKDAPRSVRESASQMMDRVKKALKSGTVRASESDFAAPVS